MTGKELYRKYIAAFSFVGIGVDSWVELDTNDHAAWDKLAELIDEGMQQFDMRVPRSPTDE